MMRPWVLSVLCLTSTLGGCIAPPMADDFEPTDAESVAPSRFSRIPEAESNPADERASVTTPEFAPFGDPPRIVVGPLGSDFDGDPEYPNAATCPFTVEARGFPAVSTDGAQVVTANPDQLSASDGEDEFFTVRWHDVAADRVRDSMSIYDGGKTEHLERAIGCPALWKTARRAAVAANERLAAVRWRTLDPFDVELVERADILDGDELREFPAPVRPVQMLYRHGQVVMRVPGVEVLAKTSASWSAEADEFCDTRPVLRDVAADRATRTVVVQLDHQSGGCLCESPTEFHTLRLDDAIFAAVAARPTDVELD